MNIRKRRLWIIAAILLTGIVVVIIVLINKEVNEKNTLSDNTVGTDNAVRVGEAVIDSRGLKEISRSFKISYLDDGKISEATTKNIPGWEIVRDKSSNEQNSEQGTTAATTNSSPEDMPAYSLSCKMNPYYQLSSDNWPKAADNAEETEYYTITCYKDDKKAWATDISDYRVRDTFAFSDGVYAVGETPLFSDTEGYAFFSRLDLSGQLLFTERLDHGLEDEEIVRIVDNGDGTCTVFSDSIPSNSMCVSSFDSEGNELFYKTINMGASIRLKDAICLGDGYLVRVTDFSASGQDYVSKFYKMDKSADITDGFYLESDGRMFFVCDMMEYGGRIYISAYEVLVPDGSKGRYEVDTVMDYIRNMQNQDEATDEAPDEGQTAAVTINLYADTPSEVLKEGLKAVYSAVLIICSADNGEPLSCYTVNGVCRSILSLDKDNKLGWKVESFVSASYAAPETDAYCMKAVCNDYLYTFDEDGTLLDSKQDGYSLFFR